MTISSAARTPAGGWSPAGDVALPPTVTLVQQLQLAPLPDGGAVLLFLGQGPAAGDVPRPYAALRSAAGAWAAPVALDPSAVVACADLGLAVDAARRRLRRLERVRRARAHVDAARRRRVRRRADRGLDSPHAARRGAPRLAGAAACCWPGSTSPACPCCAPPSGRRRASRPPPRRRCRAPRRRSRASRSPTRPRPRRSSPRRRARAPRSAPGTDVLERPAAATPWTVQNVRTGLTEPVGSPQLAMGPLGALALWVEGNVDRRLGHRPRPAAHARARQAQEGRHRRARAVLGARERHLVADRRRHLALRRRHERARRERAARLRARGHVPRHGASSTTRPATPRSARSSSSTRRSRARSRRDGDARRGLSVGDRLPALEPERDRHGDRRASRAPSPCRSAARVPGQRARRSCRGGRSAGRRVVVRVTGLDLAGLPHLRASTLTALLSATILRWWSASRVSVPASSANLGPGYDCLGVALPLRNRVEVERRPGPLEVSVSGEGAGTLPVRRDEPRRALVRRGLGRRRSTASRSACATRCRCRRAPARRARRSWRGWPPALALQGRRTAATS